MRYYAKYNESGNLIVIGTGYGGTEITESEYESLFAVIVEKIELVDKVYIGEIIIDDVRPDWQEEIQRRVDERISAESDADETEATESDYQNALAQFGVEV